jgi:hypothetical protein
VKTTFTPYFTNSGSTWLRSVVSDPCASPDEYGGWWKKQIFQSDPLDASC